MATDKHLDPVDSLSPPPGFAQACAYAREFAKLDDAKLADRRRTLVSRRRAAVILEPTLIALGAATYIIGTVLLVAEARSLFHDAFFLMTTAVSALSLARLARNEGRLKRELDDALRILDLELQCRQSRPAAVVQPARVFDLTSRRREPDRPSDKD